MALLLGASFFVKGLPLGLCFFAGLLLTGFYYVAVSRTVETAVQTTESVAVTVFGAVYVGLTLNFFLPLREEFGVSAVFFLMAVIFLGDTGAFFVGKAVGRHQMTPIASPHKTWEGAIGGLLELARRHHLRATALDVRNSGDTAGPKNQVVGYGAYVFA